MTQQTINYILQVTYLNQRFTVNISESEIASGITCYEVQIKNKKRVYLSQFGTWKHIAGLQLNAPMQEQIVKAVNLRKGNTALIYSFDNYAQA